MQLLDLQDDVILRILELCKPADLCILAQTCRRFFRLCSAPHLWVARRPLVFHRVEQYLLACLIAHVLKIPHQVRPGAHVRGRRPIH